MIDARLRRISIIVIKVVLHCDTTYREFLVTST